MTLYCEVEARVSPTAACVFEVLGPLCHTAIY